jgi:hypothetical protein
MRAEQRHDRVAHGVSRGKRNAVLRLEALGTDGALDCDIRWMAAKSHVGRRVVEKHGETFLVKEPHPILTTKKNAPLRERSLFAAALGSSDLISSGHKAVVNLNPRH